MNLEQIRRYIVVPALNALDLHSEAAERLVMATGMAESKFNYIDQVERGGDKSPGPAFGPFQMERATHDDLWKNYLDYKPDLAKRVRSMMVLNMNGTMQMQGNWYYAAAMCRIHYRRIRAPLPDANDIDRIAAYWKKYYNTKYGRGTVAGFIQKAEPVWDLYKI